MCTLSFCSSSPCLASSFLHHVHFIFLQGVPLCCTASISVMLSANILMFLPSSAWGIQWAYWTTYENIIFTVVNIGNWLAIIHWFTDEMIVYVLVEACQSNFKFVLFHNDLVLWFFQSQMFPGESEITWEMGTYSQRKLSNYICPYLLGLVKW